MEGSSFICYYETCNKSYKTKFNLRRHINSFHLKLKNFKCEECSKCFVSKQNLKEHYYIHTGEKLFQCPEAKCGKRFRQASQLAVHRRIHERGNIQVKCHQDIPALVLTGLAMPEDTECKTEKSPEVDFVALPALDSSRVCKEAKLPVLPVLLNHI